VIQISKAALASVAMFGSIMLSACGTFGLGGANEGDAGVAQSLAPQQDSIISTHEGVASLIARDLVGVLSQIDIIAPSQTTLYASRTADRVGEKMVKALQAAGYKLRLAQAEQEPRLGYNIQKDEDASYMVVISAGPVKVKRNYAIDEVSQTVQPASSIYVLGASSNNIQLNDSIFANQQAVVASKPAVKPTTSELPAEDTQIALATAVPARAKIIKQPLLPKVKTNIALDSSLKPAKKLNMYETRRSNFDELLGQFDTVRREILVFANDSLVMGEDNKQIAHDIAKRFDADTDVVSVIGCSHGKSALDNGNEKLANGRADRVREEFLVAGLNAELVLHEACWANVHFDEMMPRRGVVVTHKRKL